ncbi:hypothetical protein [Allosphingosinicella sp.]|uniref:hypothetical protein n=1 Tax=Allosphingosinicella sp. TaxID=2823234 RepID=UPI003D75C0EF
MMGEEPADRIWPEVGAHTPRHRRATILSSAGTAVISKNAEAAGQSPLLGRSETTLNGRLWREAAPAEERQAETADLKRSHNAAERSSAKQRNNAFNPTVVDSDLFRPAILQHRVGTTEEQLCLLGVTVMNLHSPLTRALDRVHSWSLALGSSESQLLMRGKLPAFVPLSSDAGFGDNEGYGQDEV